jgi:hypothetical protein
MLQEDLSTFGRSANSALHIRLLHHIIIETLAYLFLSLSSFYYHQPACHPLLSSSCSKLKMSVPIASKESSTSTFKGPLSANASSNRPSDPTSHQSQVTIQDLEHKFSTGTSSNVTCQAALLPSVNISDHGHIT